VLAEVRKMLYSVFLAAAVSVSKVADFFVPLRLSRYSLARSTVLVPRRIRIRVAQVSVLPSIVCILATVTLPASPAAAETFDVKANFIREQIVHAPQSLIVTTDEGPSTAHRDNATVALPAPKVTAPVPAPSKLDALPGGKGNYPTPSDPFNSSSILAVASSLFGVPYVYGGTTPAGFDCSGFTSYVYKQIGVTIPRTTSGQLAAGTIVDESEAQPGDIAYMPGHVGLWVSPGYYIDSAIPGLTVNVRPIFNPNYVVVRINH
jgi:cell wall-associated NlpC family hydrolase